jgi:hypothetical protein
MSNKHNPDFQPSANSTSDVMAVNENDDEAVNTVSEEEGLKSAEKIFKTEENKAEDSTLNEDREFLIYLKHCKRAKDLGFNDPTTIYQGGLHIKDSNLENYGNIAGNDQTIYTGSPIIFSGETGNESVNEKKIEAVFDECEDVTQRSFMIALAALNGCNYRLVAEASQRLQSIVKPPEETKI